MEEIIIEEVCEETVRDLALLCVPRERQEEPVFLKGVEAKSAWAKEKLESRLPWTKIACVGKEAAGLLQYHVHPRENLVEIQCIFVPERKYQGQGIGTKLLLTLIEEMRMPQVWNGGNLPEARVMHTFPGEIEGQLSAREFFLRRGFQRITEDPDLLAFPLVSDYRHQPSFRFETFSPPPPYLPQPEDFGQVLVIHGPSFCPWSFSWHLKAARLGGEALPEASIRWIEGVNNPEELRKRGGFTGIVVNGQGLKAQRFRGRGVHKRSSRSVAERRMR